MLGVGGAFTSGRMSKPERMGLWSSGTLPIRVWWTHLFWKFSRNFRVHAYVRVQWYCAFPAHWRRCRLPIPSLRVYGRARICACGVSVECVLCTSKLYPIKKKRMSKPEKEVFPFMDLKKIMSYTTAREPYHVKGLFELEFIHRNFKETRFLRFTCVTCIWIIGTSCPFYLERLRFIRKIKETKHPLESIGNFPAREG
jgi:hypothetical protein